MKIIALLCALALQISTLLVIPTRIVVASTPSSATQEPRPTPSDKRGIGIDASPSPTPHASQAVPQKSGAPKPEIVLQAGITSPQTQIGFSPDGRLLASMGMGGNSIKLWEVSSGRLLRQLESSIPSLGASSMSRPFRFSADGKTLVAYTEGRLRRWEVESGKELNSTMLPAAKDLVSAVLSEDSRTLAALSADNSSVCVWDLASGRALPGIAFEKDDRIASQESVALSPDGKVLATLIETVKGSMKGVETTFELQIWDTSSGRKTQTFKVKTTKTPFGVVRGTQTVANLAFSTDGTWLALRDESSMKIWDAATSRELKTFSTPPLTSASTEAMFGPFAGKFLFSNDRRLLSVVTEVSKISILDGTTANRLHLLSGHDGPIVGVSFTNDGKLLASSGVDNQIKLWDVATGSEVRTMSGAAMPLNDLTFSSDGKSLVLSGPQGVSSWEINTGGVKRAVTLSNDYSRSMLRNPMTGDASALSANGKMLVAGSDSKSMAKVWDVGTSREIREIALADGKELGKAAFTADGNTLVLVEKSFKKPATPSPTAAGQQPAVTPPTAMAMPDLTKLMEEARKDPKKMQERMKKVEEAMAKGDLSAGMEMMESIGMTTGQKPANKNVMRIIDVASGRQVRTIDLPGGFMNEMVGDSIMASSAVSFSPDGKLLASASGFGGPVKLIDVATGQELLVLKSALSLSVNSISWSPDGKRLASAHWGMKRNPADPNASQDFSFEDMVFSIKIWDAQTGAELNALSGHNNFVNRMVFSSDGRRIISGSYDSTIKIWDAGNGRELNTLKGHTGSITALDFSPDGRFIVSGSDDGSARLWKAETGELLATLVSLNQGADWLVVTPEGLFDGSPGGWKQILWRFTPTIFDVSPVEIFFNEYFHPGLLAEVFAGNRVAVATDISQKDRRQPRVSVAAPGLTQGNVSTRQSNLKVTVSDAPAGARDLRLFRNGSLVKAWRGDVLQGQATTTLEATVSIVAGENNFTAYAFNRDNVKSTDATLTLRGADSLKRSGTLYLLVAGVNEYANAGYNLKFAVADGQAFAQEVEKQQRKLGQFSQFEVTALYDSQASKANIVYALSRLAGINAQPPAGAPAELQKLEPAQPEDAVVVYFAGHGTAQDQRFYLIPHDLGYQGKRTELDTAGLREILTHSISDQELEQVVAGIDAGLLLMVVDACNSGQALEAEEKRRGPMNSKGLAQLAYEKGMYILTAAQSYQAALEAEQLGHGYLTFALVEEGLKSTKADTEPADGEVLLREWLNYATDRVPQMQENKMRTARGLKLDIAFVEGDEKVGEVDKRSVQRPRVFYRREQETRPIVIARP